MAFELGECRAVCREQHLAPELDRHLRRVALHAGQQRGLDALQLLRAVFDLLLQQSAERLDETVGQQDAQEGADQCRGDHAAQNGRRLADRAHRVDHTQHRCDDAKGGQAARESPDGGHRRVLFVMVGLDLAVHQAFDLVGVEVARDHHAQVVGDELDHMVISTDHRVFLEDRRVVRVFDVLLDRHQPFLAGLLQEVVEQRHQFHVARLAVLAALEARAQAFDGGLDDFHLVGGQERTQCCAEDGDRFERQRLQDHLDVSTVNDVHAKDADHGKAPTDEYEHAETVSELSALRGRNDALAPIST